MNVDNENTNVLALVKGSERYIFLYDNESKAETLRTLGRFASNPELSFTWYDAAILSQKIKEMDEKQALENNISGKRIDFNSEKKDISELFEED